MNPGRFMNFEQFETAREIMQEMTDGEYLKEVERKKQAERRDD